MSLFSKIHISTLHSKANTVQQHDLDGYPLVCLLDEGLDRVFHRFSIGSRDPMQSIFNVPMTLQRWIKLHIISRKCLCISAVSPQNGHGFRVPRNSSACTLELSIDRSPRCRGISPA